MKVHEAFFMDRYQVCKTYLQGLGYYERML